MNFTSPLAIICFRCFYFTIYNGAAPAPLNCGERKITKGIKKVIIWLAIIPPPQFKGRGDVKKSGMKNPRCRQG